MHPLPATLLFSAAEFNPEEILYGVLPVSRVPFQHQRWFESDPCISASSCLLLFGGRPWAPSPAACRPPLWLLSAAVRAEQLSPCTAPDKQQQDAAAIVKAIKLRGQISR